MEPDGWGRAVPVQDAGPVYSDPAPRGSTIPWSTQFSVWRGTSDQGCVITIIERRLEAKFAKLPARRSHFLTSAPRIQENGYFAMSAQAIKCQELISNSKSDGLSTEEDQAEFCRRSFGFRPKHGLRKLREAA